MREATAPRRPANEQPVQHWTRSEDLRICVFEWAGDGRPVILAHATGFHARTWDAVVRMLPQHRILAIDLRGHGRSENPTLPLTWEGFGLDVAAVARHFDLRDAIGVGHSMGGHSVTLAAAREPSRFASLLLLDPVIHSGASLPNDAPAFPPDAFAFITKRRNQWASPEELVERFKDRLPYSVWAPGVLNDYARYGLIPNADGEGLVLACPPEIEAAIYASDGAIPDMPSEVIPLVKVPVRVIRAREPVPGQEAPPFSTSPTWPDLASKFVQGEDVLMPEMSHFIPMQDPEFVARQVRELDANLS